MRAGGSLVAVGPNTEGRQDAVGAPGGGKEADGPGAPGTGASPCTALLRGCVVPLSVALEGRPIKLY